MAASNQQILRLPNVLERIGISRSQLYRLIGQGQFPNSIHLGERSIGWLASEVDAWIDARIAARKPARAFLAKAA